MSATMKAIEISSPGGPEVLQLCTRPVPEPEDNEILIKVAAAGVNRPDVLQRMGFYPPPPGASDLPGLEVAGTIVTTGGNVTRFAEGDEVCALLTGGGYADYAIADQGSCLPVPDGMRLVEAACLPETVFTVWANVYEDAKLKPDETLLVHGGTSGIGVTAIGLAKAFGSRVFATAGSDEKCALAKQIGADASLNYQSADWEKEFSALGGADVVLDMTGGDFVSRNIEALNPGGRHVSIAFLRGAEASINIMALMRKRLRLSGSTMKARSFEDKARLRGAIEKSVWPKIEAGEFAPRFDVSFALADAAKAHAYMENGAHFGKIALIP